jgi:hypothetical protein
MMTVVFAVMMSMLVVLAHADSVGRAHAKSLAALKVAMALVLDLPWRISKGRAFILRDVAPTSRLRTPAAFQLPQFTAVACR